MGVVSSSGSSRGIPILMYHRVGVAGPGSKVPGHYVSPGLFARHLRTIGTLGYRVIPLGSLFHDGGEPVRKALAITFDDGYASLHQSAFPALKRHGYPATVFLVAGQIGGTNVWDSSNGDVRENLLAADQIRGALDDGIEFGSHTMSHADLSALDEGEAWKELTDSKEAIEKVTGREASTLAYPYGRFSPAARAMAARAGYRLACSTQKGVNTRETDPYALKRINVRRDTWTPVLLLKLMRGAWLDR